MEGVIISFKEDRGFGFIEGQDSKRYFFHRDRISEKFFQLDNKGVPFYSNYYFHECKLDRHIPIYILEFNPLQGKKGLVASNLIPTNIRMNSEKSSFNIKVIDLKFENNSVSYHDDHPNNGAIARSYSSYVWLYYSKIGGYGKGKFDIRQKILDLKDRKKITKPLVEKIKEKIVEKEIIVRRTMPIVKLNNSDKVYRGFNSISSIYQIMLNQQKYEQDLKNEDMIFDYDLLNV